MVETLSADANAKSEKLEKELLEVKAKAEDNERETTKLSAASKERDVAIKTELEDLKADKQKEFEDKKEKKEFDKKK